MMKFFDSCDCLLISILPTNMNLRDQGREYWPYGTQGQLGLGNSGTRAILTRLLLHGNWLK